MKSYNLHLYLLFSIIHIQAQNTENDVLVGSSSAYRATRGKIASGEILRSKAGFDGCQTKIVLVNYHFMQDNNSNNNFKTTDDGLGNTQRRGYEYAIDGVEFANRSISNIQHRLPPNNTIGLENKNYRFLLNGVYFHANSTYNVMGNIRWTEHSTISPDMAIIDIFCQRKVKEHSFNPFSDPDGTGGYASSTDPNDPKFFCFNNYSVYKEFAQQYWILKNGPTWAFTDYNWALGASFNEHEAGHLFGLDHTVLYGGGAMCPTIKFGGTVDNGCDDNVWDTRSAWHMTDVLNSPIHPGDRSATANSNKQWQTNNLMDYTDAQALTPQQLNVVHYNFEQGSMKKYLLCDRLGTNRNFLSFSFPVIGYYGMNVDINRSATKPLLRVTNRQYVRTYASENTIIYDNFQVDNNSEFEVLNSCSCN